MSPSRRLLRRLVAVFAITSGVGLLVSEVSAQAVPGQQGTDTSLADTDSKVVVNGRGAFASMQFTVNQTQKLSTQAISIKWSGGTPTERTSVRFGAHFVQIYQCWGDDDGTVPGNPGPPPEQCQAGAFGNSAVGAPGSLFSDPMAYSRTVSRVGWATDSPAIGVLDAAGLQRWRVFRAVDGTEVGESINPNYNPFLGSTFWLNPYFNSITTNEISGAVTNGDGTGAELFQVLTGDEAPGLGCGKKAQPDGSGGSKVPKCWLVIVPRGDQASENANTPFANYNNKGVATSPLAPNAWKNRIAIPLEFNPVESSCEFSETERRIAGNEMALPAVANWQPLLCEAAGSVPFSYAPVADGTARSLIASGVAGSPGMAVVGEPLDAATLGPDNPAVYAPLTLSGLAIGFNIERKADIKAPPEMAELNGVRVASINLTPRLVAKLLTQSYGSQVSIYGTPTDPAHAFVRTNPAHLALDPDFLRFNPEFALLYFTQGRTMGGLQLPAGSSDAAAVLWEWVLADPEAKAWLGGAADEWGMTVNPYYNATPSANPSNVEFYNPVPNAFPKADPYCYQGPPQGAGGNVVPPLLCGTDWMPYARGFRESAQVARAASDGARISQNALAEAPSAVWGRVQPQGIGDRGIISLTDTPSAAQFGLQVAKLSRAGDNGPSRSFIAPNDASLLAGLVGLKPATGSGMLLPDPSSNAPGGYPLTILNYAALTPLALDTPTRNDYARFIEYAAGAGQVPGLGFGKLPRGYTPLPDSLRSAAVAAAVKVRTLKPAPSTSTTTSSYVPPVTFDYGDYGDYGGGGFTVDTLPVDTLPLPSDTTTTEVSSTSTTTTTVVGDGGVPTSTLPAVLTPRVDPPGNRFAVLGLGFLAIGSALAALEVTKRPRRGVLKVEPLVTGGAGS